MKRTNVLKAAATTAAAASIALAGGAVALMTCTPEPARAEFDWKSFAEGVNDAVQDYNDQVQEDTQRMLDRQRNCTTTFYGNTARTSCW